MTSISAPGKAETQLKLMETEWTAGTVGLTEFLADGLRLQEMQ